MIRPFCQAAEYALALVLDPKETLDLLVSSLGQEQKTITTH